MFRLSIKVSEREPAAPDAAAGNPAGRLARGSLDWIDRQTHQNTRPHLLHVLQSILMPPPQTVQRQAQMEKPKTMPLMIAQSRSAHRATLGQ